MCALRPPGREKEPTAQLGRCPHYGNRPPKGRTCRSINGVIMYRSLLLVIFLVTNVSFADTKPVTLRCGAIIVENSQSSVKQLSIINNVCSNVEEHYRKFVIDHHMGIISSNKFHWNVSMLPMSVIGENYSIMNGDKMIRKHGFLVDGYTNPITKHTYSISDMRDYLFKTVFAHEMFHAMNFFYGVFKNPELEEKLAAEFTEQLGYGR